MLIVIEYHSNFVSVINGHFSFWSVKYTYIVGGQTLGSVTTFLGRNHMNLFRKFKSIWNHFREGGPLLRPGKFFYGPKTDVTGKTVKEISGKKIDDFWKSYSTETIGTIG